MARLTNEELAYRTQLKNLGTLLETSQAFRRFLWTFFRDASIFDTTYSHSSSHDTAYREGRRAVGLEVLHLLKHVRPDILSLVEREGNLLAAQTPKQRDTDELPNNDDDDSDEDDGS